MSFPSSQNNTLNLWTKSKVLIYFHIFQPPYPTLQNNTLNRRRKFAFWVNFVIYHPSTLPGNMLNLWKKLTGWVLLIGLPHQNTTFNIVEQLNIWTIVASWVTFKISFPPLQSNTLTMNTDEGLSQFIFFNAPPPQNSMNVEHMKHIGILSQFWNLFPPDLTMKLTCWVESLLQTYRPVPYKTLRPFNIRANLASRVMIQMSFPSPTTKQYVEQIKTIHLESFLKVTTPRPYTAVR